MTRRRLHHLLLVTTLLAAVGWVAAATPAFACSCASVATDQTSFRQADAVFVGTVLERREPGLRLIQSSSDPATYVFDVSEVYKGRVHRTQAVETARSGASCGLELPARGEILVFAHASGPTGVLTAGLCDGTRAVSDGPVQLSAGAAPLPGLSPGAEEGGPSMVTLGVAGVAVAGLAGLVGVVLRSARRRRG